jgi:hypothetical protein
MIIMINVVLLLVLISISVSISVSVRQNSFTHVRVLLVFADVVAYSHGRERVGFTFRTTLGHRNTRKRPLFYFILFLQSQTHRHSRFFRACRCVWFGVSQLVRRALGINTPINKQLIFNVSNIQTLEGFI